LRWVGRRLGQDNGQPIVPNQPVRNLPRVGMPRLDEDYLALTTMHSAKGQEWRSVSY